MAKEVRVYRDLDYADSGNKQHTLDLYVPNRTPPLIVWIHGGGWREGSKKDPRVLRLTAKGFAVASVNYRLSGEAIFPAQIHDCKAAIRWLRKNAKKYRYRAKRIGAAGPSAGGHLAALLGTSGGVKDLEGEVGGHLDQSSRVQAVLTIFGPTDFLQMDAHRLPGGLIHDAPDSSESRMIGGPIQQNKEKVKKANPLTYLDNADPPFLAIHGDCDKIVPVHQSILLRNALQKAKIPVQLYIIKGANHGWRQRHTPKMRPVIDAFFDKYLK